MDLRSVILGKVFLNIHRHRVIVILLYVCGFTFIGKATLEKGWKDGRIGLCKAQSSWSGQAG